MLIKSFALQRYIFLDKHKKNKKTAHPNGMRCFRLNQERLFPFAQLLVAFVAELGELLGLGEEFLGFLGEGLQQ